MNLEQFLAELRKTPRKWGFTDTMYSDSIRFNMIPNLVQCCPITTVCYMKTEQMFEIKDYDRAAEALDMDDTLANLIVCASDWAGKFSFNEEEHSMRMKILDAVGLKDKES